MFSKNKSTKNNKRHMSILIFLVLIIAIGVFVYILRHGDPTNSYHPKYAVSSSESPNDNSGGGSQAESEDKNPGSDGAATSITSEQVPVASSGNIIIDDLEQKDGYINAKATVSGFTTTQCVYTFTAEDAKPVVRQINGPCQGISIPQGEFELIGTYTLTITAYNGTSQKISATKDINVQ